MADGLNTRDITHRLLAGVDSRGRRAILAASSRRRLRHSQVIYRAGEPAEHLFALSRGRVQFSRLATNGREVVLGIVGPTEVFGLGSLVARHDYIATAEAIDPGEAIVWRHDVIRRFSDTYPQLARNALQIALDYAVVIAERHEQLLSGTAEHRVALALTGLGTKVGAISPCGVEVRVKNEQLASLADVSVYTVSRLLTRWERIGAVKKSRGAVYIRTLEKLLVR